MSGNKIIVDISQVGLAVETKDGVKTVIKAQAVEAPMTDAEIAQQKIDHDNWVAITQQNNERSQLPSLEQKVQMLWAAALNGDLTAIKTADAAIQAFAAKYAEVKNV